jgi:hypothetical protein
MSAKERWELYLSPETGRALADYARTHRDRFRTASQAADHLLRRALMGAISEGEEELLVPALARIVRETTKREILDQLAPLLGRQSNRLAGLLIQSGKDAHAAAEVAAALLAQLFGDPRGAAMILEEARLAAGDRYSRDGLRSTWQEPQRP